MAKLTSVSSILLGLIIITTIFDAALSSECPTPCYCFLKTIRCTHGSLDRIPSITKPNDVEVLDLRFNRIQSVGESDLKNMTNLVTLFLSDNSIQFIEHNAFSNLKHLSYLYLYSNRLTTLPSDSFNGLPSLKQLYLQNNELSIVNNGAFRGLNQLQRLFLQGNRLQTLPRNILLPLRSLKRLRLESNRLQCDCQLLQTIQFISQQRYLHVAATCHTPEDKQGVLITTLVPADLDCRSPKISELPLSMNVLAGTSLKLACKAQGNPVPSIVWLKDGKETQQNTVSIGASFYKTESTNQSDAGEYTCLAVNAIGKAARSFKVYIVNDTEGVSPMSLKESEKIEVILNSPLVLQCHTNNLKRIENVWTKNGLPLNSKRYRLLSSGNLRISSVKRIDHSLFVCHSNHGVKKETRSINVVVKASPYFKVKPKDLEVLDSETASLQCRADGYPLPAIAWQKDGVRLPADGRHIVLSSGSLRILSTQISDEGMYECLAINVIGVNSSKALLQVNPRVPPTIMVYPGDTTVQSGNTIHFSCKAEGAPIPLIVWIKNGVQVSSGNRLTADPTAGSLEIRDIGAIDAGSWECAARNSVGFASKLFNLDVVGGKGKNVGDQYVRPSFEQAKDEVDRAIALTKEKLRNFKPSNPGDLLSLFRFPSAEAIELARAAEIFEVALEIIQKQIDQGNILSPGTKKNGRKNLNSVISPNHVQLLANLSGCTAYRKPVNCSDMCFHRKYRTYDGSCNNLANPMQAASLTPFSRLLSPVYENGFNTPVGWNTTGAETLPSARLISMKLVSTANITNDPSHTHMLMQWGQFVDHDLDFTASSPSSSRFEDGEPCRVTCHNTHPCFPIQLPHDDPRRKRHQCMEFTRSSAVCGSGSTSVFFGAISPRQQINQITSYIDASNVYGSSRKDAMALRDLNPDRGLLRTSIADDVQSYMPFNKDTPIDCQMNKSNNPLPCFLAGDHRANEHLGLLSMHTLWVRHHNRIATYLSKLNNEWDGEKTYQETRKIVAAQMQHITYTEFLPKILGKQGMDHMGAYQGYKSDTDASIFNAFATAAYRFGHTLVQPILMRLNESLSPIEHGNLPLHKSFFSPYRLVEEGGIDPILRGLFASPAKSRLRSDELVTDALTNHLFEMAHTIALDLAALNIQRGRDHGLPGYNSWRQFCNLTEMTSFDDFKDEVPNEKVRTILQSLYDNPGDIDLWIGGILEKSLPGSRLGPLFNCLISLQFQRLRDGDRFWYENPSTFSRDQLLEIKKTTLAEVICQNGNSIKRVPSDVFKLTKNPTDELINCEDLPSVNLRFWKECHDDQQGMCDSQASSPHTIDNDVDNVLVSSNDNGRIVEDINPRDSLKVQLNDLVSRQNLLSSELKTISSQMRSLLQQSDPRKYGELTIDDTCIDQNLMVRQNKESWLGNSNQTCICQKSVALCVT